MWRSRAIAGALVGIVLAAGGCSSGGGGGDRDAGSFFRCDDDTDCNDMTECTVDSCAVGGVCSFMAVDALCGAGESCIAGRGCVAGTPCNGMTPGECDDSIACTIDSCGVGGTCRHMALDELCTDPALGTCDATMGCVAGSGCSTAADCDDAIPCTVDVCGADMTCRHTPVNSECATGEVCSPSRGCFTPMPCTTAADCDDGVFCNGAEECIPEFGCAPAAAPRMCNDSNDCTVDSCDASLDMCVFQCDPTRGATCAAMCPPPAAACTGRFRLTGTTSFGCAIFGVSVDMSEATFDNAGDLLTVVSRDYTTMPDVPGGLTFTDDAAPVCPDFVATATVMGDTGMGCDEIYQISGTFSDDDHFAGTVTWSFVGDTGFGPCSDFCPSGSGSVTGVRIP